MEKVKIISIYHKVSPSIAQTSTPVALARNVKAIGTILLALYLFLNIFYNIYSSGRAS